MYARGYNPIPGIGLYVVTILYQGLVYTWLQSDTKALCTRGYKLIPRFGCTPRGYDLIPRLGLLFFLGNSMRFSNFVKYVPPRGAFKIIQSGRYLYHPSSFQKYIPLYGEVFIIKFVLQNIVHKLYRILQTQKSRS